MNEPYKAGVPVGDVRRLAQERLQTTPVARQSRSLEREPRWKGLVLVSPFHRPRSGPDGDRERVLEGVGERQPASLNDVGA